MLRRIVVVVALFWAMSQAAFLRAASGEGVDPGTMLAFGFIVLVAATLGELAHRVHLPHVTGYILTGIVCGEYVLGLLSPEAVRDLKLFDILAIGLIAMEAGAALDVEGIRRRWRAVAGITGALIVLSIGGGLIFAGVGSGRLGLPGLGFLAGADMGLVVAVGLLTGVMVLATSPPVTLAVVNEARARGEFTDTLLSSVIINNVQVVVLFAVALAAAEALLGVSEGGAGAAVAAELGWSIVLGVGVAAVAAAALRFIPEDALLVLVALAFVGTWLTDQVDASPLLTFLVAGALLNAATRQGPAFKARAATLSGPVYVLFFTLVGADLHLSALSAMAPWAVALVVLRLAVFWGSVLLADRIVGLSLPLRRFAALGLAPQAGIALTIAIAVGERFAGWGTEFETLGLAAIALNEMVGPVLLKFALNLSGDTAPEADEAADGAAEGEAGDPVEAALRAPPLPGDPFARVPRTGVIRLDEIARELSADLAALVRDFQGGPVARRQREAHAFLQSMRREVLRVYRRLGVRAAEPDVDGAALAEALRGWRAELAVAWKGHLLARASAIGFKQEQAALDVLVRSVDRLARELPAATTAPYAPEHLRRVEGDAAGVVVRKALLRARVFGRRFFGQREALRVVEVRTIGRYHLSGRLPPRLEQVAGLLALSERHLLDRVDNLVDGWFQMERRLSDRLAKGLTAAERRAAVEALRREFEQAFAAVAREVDRLADETVRVAAGALAGVVADFARDCGRAGTPYLSRSAHRFSRVYRERERAVEALREGFAAARDLARGLASAQAMELELVRLVAEVDAVVEEVADQAGRDVRGRIALQFDRLGEALDQAMAAIEQLLRAAPRDPHALLDGFEAIVAPLQPLADQAVQSVQDYQQDLENADPFEPLIARLSAAVEQLTERYTIAVGAPSVRGRGLPRAASVVEVPFRAIVREAVETRSTRRLGAISERLHDQVEAAWRAIRDLDRALVFASEVVRSELELLPEGMVVDSTIELLRDTLLGTHRRVASRVHELAEEGRALAADTERGVRDATLGSLQELAALLVSGKVGEIRALMAARAISAGRRELGGVKSAAVAGARQLRALVGEPVIAAFRDALGLPHPEGGEERPGPERFAMPEPRVALPMAYRRLFSDEALEAGDLLAGREGEVSRLLKVMLGELGGCRAAALISVGGMGKEAVVEALLRGIGERARVERHRFAGPGADAAQVDEVLAAARQAERDHRQLVVVVEGIEWAFSIRPGGFELLRRFVSGVVETSEHVGWLVSFDRPVWAYLDRVVRLHDVFPERFHLDPLDAEGLRHALLSRHGMSGYKLEFRPAHRTLRDRLGLGFRRGPVDWEDRFFARIHEDSGGVLGDALRLWMASIVRVDGDTETLVLRQPPEVPVVALRELGDDELVALRQVARQGRLSPDEHAAQFRLEPEVSHAFLARLAHWGLLERDEDGRFRMAGALAGPIYRVLRERELVG